MLGSKDQRRLALQVNFLSVFAKGNQKSPDSNDREQPAWWPAPTGTILLCLS
jgi:hypothetical protein